MAIEVIKWSVYMLGFLKMFFCVYHFYIEVLIPQFSDDYKYLTVTPINGWLGNKQGLIGLLFVTSKNKNILKKVNIDLFRFSADILASTLVSKLSIIEAYSPVEPIKKEIR